MSHPSAKVRRAAVRSLVRTSEDQYREAVIERVLDAAPSVSAQAQRAPQPYAASIGATALRALFAAPAPAHVRRNLLQLLASLPKWESISCLIEAAADPDEALASSARAYVVKWHAEYNRSQSAPSRDQVARLAAALSQSAAALGIRQTAQIEFALAAFRES